MFWMNSVEFEVKSLKYQWKLYNLSICNKTMKLNNTRACLKMKVFLWNEVICSVSTKIKIILIGSDVVIILINNKLVLIMNPVEFERNSLEH